MKRSLIAVLLSAVLILSAAGCGGKKKIPTEMAVQNITSMTVDGQGTVYLLSDTGLRSYTLSGDKRIEYVYDSEDMAEFEFRLNDKGEDIVYSAFQPERIISNGETGLQFLGRYRSNDLRRASDLFVVQDIADINYTAAYYYAIEQEPGSKTPLVNGVGVTDSGIYLKLNRSNIDEPRFDIGSSLKYYGYESPYEMPDNVTGAFEVGEDDEATPYFLTRNGSKAAVVSDGKTIAEFSETANAFVSDSTVYVIYKNGKITSWTLEKGEKSFADLKTKLTSVNDPFIWKGTIYWFDKEGVKRSK